jgi:hypothetical protein
MATTLTKPVGIRNGQTPMPNEKKDLDKVTDLFDRISFAQGGSMEIGGLWATERSALILEVTAQIVTFQTRNGLVVDGVIDQTGDTLKLLNQLARPPRFTVTIRSGSPELYDTTISDSKDWFVVPPTVPGKKPMDFVQEHVRHNFRIYRVDGLERIHWFSVVTPVGRVGPKPTCVFFFLPDVGQESTAGFSESEYEAMAPGSRWEGVLRAYSQVMGSQMIASDPENLVLIIPLRPMSVDIKHELGDLNDHWKTVGELLATDAVMQEDPFAIRTDALSLNSVITASYSSGLNVHANFVKNARGLDAVREASIEIDGDASWSAPRSMVFKEDHPNHGGNYFTRGRWGKLPAAAVAKHRIKTTHWQIAQYMLHAGLGLWQLNR